MLKFQWHSLQELLVLMLPLLFFVVVNSQVAGYAMTYKEGLTFATVRNSGSKVGLHQPERAFTMFKSFLDNTPLPSSPYFPISS
ncbi:hypothetical protein QJS10_CPA10g00906 [Acorus calamus]|uniref:Uncharacterized protein n=1 Tax=Acorus calamus TaxID=4465 RepID=A0AAV9E1X3_ACOCL|nr:hypothetical protein QJS10_CPA10g00906 [Acorus calamus]